MKYKYSFEKEVDKKKWLVKREIESITISKIS